MHNETCVFYKAPIIYFFAGAEPLYVVPVAVMSFLNTAASQQKQSG